MTWIDGGNSLLSTRWDSQGYKDTCKILHLEQNNCMLWQGRRPTLSQDAKGTKERWGLTVWQTPAREKPHQESHMLIDTISWESQPGSKWNAEASLTADWCRKVKGNWLYRWCWMEKVNYTKETPRGCGEQTVWDEQRWWEKEPWRQAYLQSWEDEAAAASKPVSLSPVGMEFCSRDPEEERDRAGWLCEFGALAQCDSILRNKDRDELQGGQLRTCAGKNGANDQEQDASHSGAEQGSLEIETPIGEN